MKNQKKLNLRVRDLTPLKDVVGGRHRIRGLHGHGFGFVRRGENGTAVGLFGFRKIQ